MSLSAGRASPTRAARLAVGLAALAALLVAAGCSQDDVADDAVDATATTSAADQLDADPLDRDSIFDAIDVDEDGVVARDDYEAELAARHARERAAELDAAFAVLAGERDTVVLSAVGIELTVDDVLMSLIEFPPSQLDDPANPTREWFTERLENMIDLRLLGVALTDFGFDVDLDASDVDINQQVVDIFAAGEFDTFARDRVLSDNPELLERLAPRCVSVLLTETLAQAQAARNRVVEGDDFDVVAADVGVIPANADGTASLGCAVEADWSSRVGAFADTFVSLGAGEVGEPYRIETEVVDGGEVFAVAFVDEVREPEDNPDDLTAFRQMLLLDQVRSYDVTVEPRLGTWDREAFNIVTEPTA